MPSPQLAALLALARVSLWLMATILGSCCIMVIGIGAEHHDRSLRGRGRQGARGRLGALFAVALAGAVGGALKEIGGRDA